MPEPPDLGEVDQPRSAEDEQDDRIDERRDRPGLREHVPEASSSRSRSSTPDCARRIVTVALHLNDVGMRRLRAGERLSVRITVRIRVPEGRRIADVDEYVSLAFSSSRR